MCQPHLILYKFCACPGEVITKPCSTQLLSKSLIHGCSTPCSNDSTSTTSAASSSSSSTNDDPLKLASLPIIELHCYCDIHSAKSFISKRDHRKKMEKESKRSRPSRAARRRTKDNNNKDAGTTPMNGEEGKDLELDTCVRQPRILSHHPRRKEGGGDSDSQRKRKDVVEEMKGFEDGITSQRSSMGTDVPLQAIVRNADAHTDANQKRPQSRSSLTMRLKKAFLEQRDKEKKQDTQVLPREMTSYRRLTKREL